MFAYDWDSVFDWCHMLKLDWSNMYFLMDIYSIAKCQNVVRAHNPRRMA